MSGESHDPKKAGRDIGEDRQAHRNTPPKTLPKTPPAAAMPPAGPHAEPHLTNPDATPGTGSLTKTDHGEVETDPGGG